MARIFITGSSTGLGRLAAAALLAAGHEVVVHARSHERLETMDDLVARGATALVGDLADATQVRGLAGEAAEIGRLDAVIHNAAVIDGRALLPVNVVAPYLLTALMPRPRRLVYLSSGMHRGGRATLAGLDWSGGRVTATYSDTKLFVTAIAFAIARMWPDVISSAVDPGWVPTNMGGPGAPDDLRLGHLTQEWLATSDDAAARVSGGYWYHQQRQTAHPSAGDRRFQDALLDALRRHTGAGLE
jgi:NAD(P)-dependent dehydrogenase (short-subunit alcohol dehydrogenase family)